MNDHIKAGDEVSFPGLQDIRLVVEEVDDGKVRCKYYDDLLQRFIRLTVPPDALVRSQPIPPPASGPLRATPRASGPSPAPAPSNPLSPASGHAAPRSATSGPAPAVSTPPDPGVDPC